MSGEDTMSSAVGENKGWESGVYIGARWLRSLRHRHEVPWFWR